MKKTKRNRPLNQSVNSLGISANEESSLFPGLADNLPTWVPVNANVQSAHWLIGRSIDYLEQPVRDLRTLTETARKADEEDHGDEAAFACAALLEIKKLRLNLSQIERGMIQHLGAKPELLGRNFVADLVSRSTSTIAKWWDADEQSRHGNIMQLEP